MPLPGTTHWRMLWQPCRQPWVPGLQTLAHRYPDTTSMASRKLSKYRGRRDFARTLEPSAPRAVPKSAPGQSSVLAVAISHPRKPLWPEAGELGRNAKRARPIAGAHGGLYLGELGLHLDRNSERRRRMGGLSSCRGRDGEGCLPPVFRPHIRPGKAKGASGAGLGNSAKRPFFSPGMVLSLAKAKALVLR